MVRGVVEELVLDGLAGFGFQQRKVKLIDFSWNEILEVNGQGSRVEANDIRDCVIRLVLLGGAIGPLGLVGEGVELKFRNFWCMREFVRECEFKAVVGNREGFDIKRCFIFQRR